MIRTIHPLRVIAACIAACSPAFAAEVLRNGNLQFENPRHFALTQGADFAKSSFQAEITVTLKGGGGDGCAFFGLGAGKPDANNYNEPSTKPSLAFRFSPSDFAGGHVTASVNGEPTGDQMNMGDGTHRVRLTWDATGRRAWLDIHRNWSDGTPFAPSLSMYLPAVAADFNNNGHLFAGGSGGVTFTGFQVKTMSAEELAKLPASDVFTKDATARTWLPVAGKSAYQGSGDPTTRAIDVFLKDLGASLRPLVCWYAGSSLQASRILPGGNLELPGSRWQVAVEAKPVDGEPDARDLTLSFTLRAGTAMSSGVAAAFDFTTWNRANYVLIPASVYNGNRYRTVGRGYNAGLEHADYYRKDLPLTQTVVPRLEIENGKPSKLEVSACNVSTPAVCIHDPVAKRGFILLAEQAGRNGQGEFLRKPDGEILDNGFAIEESSDRTRATVVVGAPGVREHKPEFIGFSGSPDRGMTLKAGDIIRLKIRLYAFATPDIPGLLARFMTVRKDVTGPNHPRNLAPASQVETWMSQRIDSRYLQQGQTAFYCPENGPWIAFGWIGGWIDTFPMLVLGDAQRLDRVAKTFDYGLKAQEPSGYFHYAIRNDGNTTFRDPAPDMNMARTSGDMLFWMVKQFQLLKAQGRGKAIKPEWENAMRKLADAMIATWRKDGQWGKLINVKTGAVGEYNTSGGVTIVGALALASSYYGNAEYLKIAKEAADFYYLRDFVKQGQTTGACADILQNADSETAAAFTTSLMTLYEITGDKSWLDKSRHLADLAATWVVSHDYELPKSTELGGLGAKLAGVVWASTQNKHGAPGICTSSGDALFKIYRATGETRYAELIRDIIHAHGESIRPGGFTNERLTFCDADSRGSRGGHVTGWNETNGILMAEEIPGIYLRTDTDRFYVFDSVEAKPVKREPTGITIEIKNPTPFDAKVSIFAENAAQAAKAQGCTALVHWPKVSVKAGATVSVSLTSDGSVRSD